ncbi:MAG: DUF4340 domain-containing protein [Phycisphaerales bacterium]|nr:DUF4340 domain-containing protein [Phycisphaerales bacterium]
MSSSFKTLLIVTGVVAAAAVAVVSMKSKPAATTEGGPALPSLQSGVNDVGAITVIRSSGTASVTRDGNKWIVPAKEGFPADPEKIRTALLGLRDLQLVEPKTSTAEFYPKLGVQDVRVVPKPAPNPDGSTPAADTKDAAPGALVELKDASGKSLGSLIVGNSAGADGDMSRPVQSGQYVRRAGETQSWLTKGTVWLDADSMNWIDRKVVGVERVRLKSATVRRVVASGPQPANAGEAAPDLELVRSDAAAASFDAVGKPEGKNYKPNEAPDQVVSVIAYLGMEDVRKDPGTIIGNPDPKVLAETDASKKDNQAHPTTTQFVTFDGLVVTVKTGFHDAKWWASVSAEAAADAIPPAAGKEGDDKAKAEAEAKKATLAKEVDLINARCKGWLFAISQFDAKRLSTKLSELIAPDTPAPSTPEVGPPGSNPVGPLGTPMPPK